MENNNSGNLFGYRELPFRDVVRLRKSCRGFLPDVVPSEIIRSVLEDAQLTPSNCNTQPWNTHIVSGPKLAELSKAILEARKEENYSLDFSFDMNEFYGRYGERQKEQGTVYYKGLGVARGDLDARRAAADQNLFFFNAPHVALLFMPSFGDNVRVAADIGMYGQTFLLSLTDHGLAGVPQTYLGSFADTIRNVLAISSDLKMMFGISFGYPDPDAPGNSINVGRDSIMENVTFHQ